MLIERNINENRLKTVCDSGTTLTTVTFLRWHKQSTGNISQRGTNT